MSSASLAYAALSVHSFIHKIGDYAGFLAVIGVALLVIMFFVQARETANLRDRTEDAEDRLAQLEYQTDQAVRAAAAAQQAAAAAQAQLSQVQAAAAQPSVAQPPIRAVAGRIPPRTPAPAVANGQTVVSKPALATVPEAPFGTAAPALSAATRMVPAHDEEIAAARAAAVQAPVAAVAAAPAPAPDLVPQSPPPSTAAGNGATTPPVVPPPVTGAEGGPGGRGSTSPPPPRAAPRRDYRAGAGSEGRRIGRASWLVAGVLVVVIAAAVVLIVMHNSNSNSNSNSPSSSKSHAAASATTKQHGKAGKSQSSSSKTVNVVPSTVNVAVLNGTSTTNLAADVSQKLAEDGFQQGPTGNATDQTETTTSVGYLPGQRAQALSVAKVLDLSNNVVKPVSSSDREVACSATPTNCPAQVVVTVGADLASIA